MVIYRTSVQCKCEIIKSHPICIHVSVVDQMHIAQCRILSHHRRLSKVVRIVKYKFLSATIKESLKRLIP